MGRTTLRLSLGAGVVASALSLVSACGGGTEAGTDGGAAGDGGVTPMLDAAMPVGDGGARRGDAGPVIMDDAGASSFQGVVTLLRAACAGCHTSTTTSGFSVGTSAAANMAAYMDLTAEAPSAACGGRTARVTPGDADDSYLILRLTGTTCGPRMPAGRAPLSAAQIDSIRRWIDAGAPGP